MLHERPVVESMGWRSPPIAVVTGNMAALWRDFQYGVRVMAQSPGFAVLAVLTLGIGMACTTTVFSWADSIVLHPYPGTARSGELVAVEMATSDAPNGGTSISWPDFRDYRERMRTLAGLAVYRQSAFALGDEEPARLAWGEFVSGNYFQVMGVRPVLGQVFTEAENGESLGAYPVAVISERLWRGYFRGDPDIAGRTVRINRRMLTVVGVAPRVFRGSSPVIEYDLWVPATMGPAMGAMSENAFRERGNRGAFGAVGRLGAGVSVLQARTEARAVAARLAEAFPDTNRRVSATVLPAWEAHNGVNEYLRAPLAILMGVSLLVLLIVCANVANLLLARSVGRQREFGIRLALGAGRGQVAAQVLRETLLLAMAGAGTGMLMLLWMQGTLLAMVPRIGIPLSLQVEWNGRILGFTAVVCVAAAVLAGASPAMLVFKSNLRGVLQEGSRGDTAGGGSRRMRGVLVMVEVALATVALAGAGLFLQSFRNLQALDTGLDASNVALGRFFLEASGYQGQEALVAAEHLRERLLATPGVEGASFSDFVPLSNTAGPYNTVQVDGYTPAEGESMAVNRALVSPGYFGVVRIPLVEGRDFTDLDTKETERVMIVNQAFARRYFGGRSPLGRRVRAGGQWYTVVGLARDSKYFSPAEAASPHFYQALRQVYGKSPELYVMARGRSVEAAGAAIRQAAAEMHGAAYHGVALAEYMELASFGQKVAANLMGGLGLLCLVLAGLGLYSVMSYTVSQRIPEIGIRMAMGAQPWDVIGMILKEGVGLALAGVAVGLAAAVGLARVVGTLLVGIGGADVATLAGAGLFLVAVGLAAAWLPAFRATRIDPMTALRK